MGLEGNNKNRDTSVRPFPYRATQPMLDEYGWLPGDLSSFVDRYGRSPYRIEEELDQRRPVTVQMFGEEVSLRLDSHYGENALLAADGRCLEWMLRPQTTYDAGGWQGQFVEDSWIVPAAAFKATLCVQFFDAEGSPHSDRGRWVCRLPLVFATERPAGSEGWRKPEKSVVLDWLAAQPKSQTIATLPLPVWRERFSLFQDQVLLESVCVLESVGRTVLSLEALAQVGKALESRLPPQRNRRLLIRPDKNFSKQGLVRFQIGDFHSAMPTTTKGVDRLLSLFFAEGAYPDMQTVKRVCGVRPVEPRTETPWASGGRGA